MHLGGHETAADLLFSPTRKLQSCFYELAEQKKAQAAFLCVQQQAETAEKKKHFTGTYGKFSGRNFNLQLKKNDDENGKQTGGSNKRTTDRTSDRPTD